MRMTLSNSAAIGLAICLFSGVASAEEMKFKADLTGAAEVPPVETSASGMMEATYDSETKKLSWTTDYSDLSDEPNAAHFHGPAKAGENAKPAVPVEVAAIKEGSADLTEEQATMLMDGLLYFNIHTAAHPGGELRGQVMKAE